MNFKLNERNKDAINHRFCNDCILYSCCFKKQRLENKTPNHHWNRCFPKKIEQTSNTAILNVSLLLYEISFIYIHYITYN